MKNKKTYLIIIAVCSVLLLVVGFASVATNNGYSIFIDVTKNMSNMYINKSNLKATLSSTIDDYEVKGVYIVQNDKTYSEYTIIDDEESSVSKVIMTPQQTYEYHNGSWTYSNSNSSSLAMMNILKPSSSVIDLNIAFTSEFLNALFVNFRDGFNYDKDINTLTIEYTEKDHTEFMDNIIDIFNENSFYKSDIAKNDLESIKIVMQLDETKKFAKKSDIEIIIKETHKDGKVERHKESIHLEVELGDFPIEIPTDAQENPIYEVHDQPNDNKIHYALSDLSDYVLYEINTIDELKIFNNEVKQLLDDLNIDIDSIEIE